VVAKKYTPKKAKNQHMESSHTKTKIQI